jgi:hypothetical protein
MSVSSPAGSLRAHDDEDDEEIKAFEQLLSSRREEETISIMHGSLSGETAAATSASEEDSGSGAGPRFTRVNSEVVYGLVDALSPRPTPTSYARHMRQFSASPSVSSYHYGSQDHYSQDSLNETSSSAGMRVEQMKRKVMELTNESKAKDIRHKIVNERASLLESSLNSALDSLKHHKNAKLAMEKKVEQLVREHMTKDERIRALKKQLEALENDGGGRVAELRAHLDDRAHEVSVLEQQVGELRMENTELIAELEMSNRELSKLRLTTSEGMSEQVRDLMGQKARGEGALEAMRSEVASLRSKADDCTRLQGELALLRAAESPRSAVPAVDEKHNSTVLDRLTSIERILEQQGAEAAAAAAVVRDGGSGSGGADEATIERVVRESSGGVADQVVLQLQSQMSSTVDDMRVDIQASLENIPAYVNTCLEKLETKRDEEHDRELKEALHDLMDKLNETNFGVQQTQQLVAMGIVNVNVSEGGDEDVKSPQVKGRSSSQSKRRSMQKQQQQLQKGPTASSELVQSLSSVMASMTDTLRESVKEVDRRQGRKLSELQTFIASELAAMRGGSGDRGVSEYRALTAQLDQLSIVITQQLPTQVQQALQSTTDTLLERLPLEIAQDWSGAMMKMNEQLELLRSGQGGVGVSVGHSLDGVSLSSSQSFATASDKLSDLLRSLNRKVMNINIGQDDRNALLNEISTVLDEAYRRQSVVGDSRWAANRSPSASFNSQQSASSSLNHSQRSNATRSSSNVLRSFSSPSASSSLNNTRELSSSQLTATPNVRTPVQSRTDRASADSSVNTASLADLILGTDASLDRSSHSPLLNVSRRSTDFEQAADGQSVAALKMHSTDVMSVLTMLKSYMDHTQADVGSFSQTQLESLREAKATVNDGPMRASLMSILGAVKRMSVSAGPSVVRASVEDCMGFLGEIVSTVDNIKMPSIAAVKDRVVKLADTLHQLQSALRNIHKMTAQDSFSDTNTSVLSVKVDKMQATLLPGALEHFDKLNALLTQGTQEMHELVGPFIAENMQTSQVALEHMAELVAGLHRAISGLDSALDAASYAFLAGELKQVETRRAMLINSLMQVRQQIAMVAVSPSSSPSKSASSRGLPKAVRSLDRLLTHCEKLEAQLDNWAEVCAAIE